MMSSNPSTPIVEIKKKKPIYKKWWFWVIVVVVVISVIGGLVSDNNISTNNSTCISIAQSEIEANSTAEKQKPSIEYQNALKKAESYSKIMYMSKKAIYNQLTSEYGEKFSADAAQYAIDNLNADYKANALAKAKSYQKTMNMSKSAIYDQLISVYGEQFTEEEAQWAIDHLND